MSACLQIFRARLGGEARRIAFPDDAGVVRQRESDVLLAEQHSDPRADRDRRWVGRGQACITRIQLLILETITRGCEDFPLARGTSVSGER